MSSRTYDFASLARAAWGEEFYEPDVVYKFPISSSTFRDFRAPSNQGGIYAVSGNAIDLEQQDAANPNVYPDLLQEDSSRLLQE